MKFTPFQGCSAFHNPYQIDQNSGHYSHLEPFNVYSLVPEDINVFKSAPSLHVSSVDPAACQYKQSISSNPYYHTPNQSSMNINFQNAQSSQSSGPLVANDKPYNCNCGLDNQMYPGSINGNSIMDNGFDIQTSQINTWMQNL